MERHVKFIEPEIIDIPNRYDNSIEITIEIPIEIDIDTSIGSSVETSEQIACRVLIAKNMAASERMRLRHVANRAAKAAVPQPPAPVSHLLFLRMHCLF